MPTIYCFIQDTLKSNWLDFKVILLWITYPIADILLPLAHFLLFLSLTPNLEDRNSTHVFSTQLLSVVIFISQSEINWCWVTGTMYRIQGLGFHTEYYNRE